MNRHTAWGASWAIAIVCLSIAAGTVAESSLVAFADPVAKPPSPGRLLFTYRAGLWLLDLADGEPRQIVEPPENGMVTGARWSPDGTQVAYVQYRTAPARAPAFEVLIAAADGSNRRRVLGPDEPGTSYQGAAWGPDGASVFSAQGRFSASGQVLRIVRVNLASGQTSTAVDEMGAFDVSADGRLLALVRTTGSEAGLDLVDLESGARRSLVPPAPQQEISAVRFDPTSSTLLLSGTALAAPATGMASPLPVQAAALGAHGPPQDLYTLSVPGGPIRLVGPLAADDPVAAWGPDGRAVAVLSPESLLILDLASGLPTVLLRPGAYGTVDWTR